MTFKANDWLHRKWLAVFVMIAFSVGAILESNYGNSLDYWVHDAAVVFQSRIEWRHTALVVLDDAIPVQVGRKQALPLFALAAQRMLEHGARGVFLDARIAKDMEGVMPYAKCIESENAVRWSKPSCSGGSSTRGKCQLRNSTLGEAPLKMTPALINRFRIAPYIAGQEQLPDFLLYDWEAEEYIPKKGLVAQDRLATKESSIARWFDLDADYAAVVMAGLKDGEKLDQSIASNDPEQCDNNVRCRRIRLSKPVYKVQTSAPKPVLPVSQLAACDEATAAPLIQKAKGRVVILQMTAPTEATDILVTPFTTAFFGPKLLTPGAQYLVDAVETILQEDHPRGLPSLITYAMFLAAAILSVWLGTYFPQNYLWVTGIFLGLLLIAFCFLISSLQLWPVTSTMAVYLCGALQTIATHLVFGFREGRLIRQYMPSQVHDLLIPLKENETFRNRRHQVIVLMSDLASYTTITDLLEEPSHVLKLMNDYLSETSFVIQDKYQGWLESYIGDMVCYYWPYNAENKDAIFTKALHGAVELSLLQKRFFESVAVRYRGQFDSAALDEICKIINAGIGMASGSVVMGDLGPKNGVRKFGILGGPMNRTARIEGLTRFFNTDIILTDAFVATAQLLDYPVRRLGRVRVKGRKVAETIYAVGMAGDARFDNKAIDMWERWLESLEKGHDSKFECPAVYAKDKEALLIWHSRGLMDQQGVWRLDEK